MSYPRILDISHIFWLNRKIYLSAWVNLSKLLKNYSKFLQNYLQRSQLVIFSIIPILPHPFYISPAFFIMAQIKIHS